LRKSFSVPFSAYDLTADDRGRVYLSGEARDWTDVAAVDAEQGAVLARWGGIWTRSLLRLSADQKRLYVATQGVNPGSADALVLPARPEENPALYPAPAPHAPAL